MLYDIALDIFWKRVAVMEKTSRQHFTDLPQQYR
jgi:hypothetical protein